MAIKNSLPPFILVLVSLLIGLTVGFGVFFYVVFKQPQLFQSTNKTSINEVKTLNDQVNSLKSEISQLKNSSNKPSNNSDDVEPNTYLLKKPILVFKPANSYSSSEKEILVERLINPYFDYNNDSELDSLVMVISKNTPPVSGYYYTINVQTKGGATTEFLYSSSNTNQDWWLPECTQSCAFSDEFKVKYPKIVSQFQ